MSGDQDPTTRYQTMNGSTVYVSGKHRGIHEMVFDWFEEGACVEAKRNVSAEIHDDPPMLRWWCECHGSDQARIFKCQEQTDG